MGADAPQTSVRAAQPVLVKWMGVSGAELSKIKDDKSHWSACQHVCVGVCLFDVWGGVVDAAWQLQGKSSSQKVEHS